MRKISKRRALVNSIGAVGYLLTIVAYLLLVSVVLALLFSGGPMAVVAPEAAVGGSDAEVKTANLFGYLVAAVMLLLTIVVIVTLPYFAGKWSSRFMRMIMKLMKVRESRRAVFWTKCCVATVPLVGFLALQFIFTPGTMLFAALHIATIFAVSLSLGCFLVQLVLGRRYRIASKNIW